MNIRNFGMILLAASFALSPVTRAEEDVTRVAQPRLVLNPPLLPQRREAQIAMAAELGVFHDFRFTDRWKESGITFAHRIVDDAGKTYKAVHYDHGNGMAVADVDNDGLYDVLFITQVGGNELWRNLGGGRFENITGDGGLAMNDRISVASSFADIDNDGDQDVYVTAVRTGNKLFENDGKGGFRDITEYSGTGHAAHSSGAVFFDYDRDGLVDLFVTNVGQYTSELVRRSSADGVEYLFHDGFSDAFSGHLFPERAEQSVLYRNLGKNRFEDVSKETGLIDTSWSGDATAGDFNGDGWSDLYVLNMQGHDHYWQNLGGEQFEDKSEALFPRTSWGAMGIKAMDWNNDGRVDLFVTDMHSDMSEQITPEREKLKSEIRWNEDHLRSGGRSIYGNTFFERQPDGRYEEISDRIGAENYWPWGLSAGDLNADGWEDVFVTASMNFPFRYGVNSLLLNDAGTRLHDAEFILGVEPRAENVTAQAWFRLNCDAEDATHDFCRNRAGIVEVWGSRGTRSSAIFDLDDDGDLDIVTNEFNAEPMVLISNLAERNPAVRYLKLRLIGKKSNRNGLGTRVAVRTDAGSQVQWMDGKSGYLSQSVLPLYFGLGTSGRVEEVHVTWPDGKTQTVTSPGINTVVEVSEQ